MSAFETPLGEGMGSAVHLSGVVHLYPSPDGDVVALRGVDLDVASGEAVALLGPSGAGKSTVLRLLAGEFPPSAGSVSIGGLDIGRMSADALARLRAREISLVIQGASPNLLSYLSASQNVWFAQHGARRRDRALPYEPMELLDLFGLQPLADVRVDEMSSGEKQLVALVAGVAVLPRLLLIDEPTSQMNADERDRVIDTILAIHQRLRITVIIVTHDPEIASRLERTVTIRDGLVGAEGRFGAEFALVGRDGSMQLPPEVLDLLPSGSRVRVLRRTDHVELWRADDGGLPS